MLASMKSRKPKVHVTLLASSTSPTMIQRRLRIPNVAIPVAVGTDLLGAWCKLFRGVFADVRKPIALFRNYEEVPDWAAVSNPVVQVQIDSSEHRGTAGVLSDFSGMVSEGLDEESWFVVVEANSCPRADLISVRDKIETLGSGLIIGVDDQDSPTGLFAISRSVLDLVPRIGYFDLKEQLVPRAVEHKFPVVDVPQQRTFKIDSLVNWRKAIASLAQDIRDPAVQSGCEESELIGDCLIDVGAKIRGATIINSIIMRGAIVEPGAIVARSVVAAHAVIPSGMSVVDGVYLMQEKP